VAFNVIIKATEPVPLQWESVTLARPAPLESALISQLTPWAPLRVKSADLKVRLEISDEESAAAEKVMGNVVEVRELMIAALGEPIVN
jgi:hypothetical protein